MEFIYLIAFIILGFIVFKGSSDNKLSKRQKDYRKYLGSEQNNDLIVLCRNCHAKYHNKYKK